MKGYTSLAAAPVLMTAALLGVPSGPLPAPAAIAGAQTVQPSPAALQLLDFEFYRTRIEPILVSPRPGHARCVACHSRGGGNSFLEPLAPGSTTYDEEQSRRNFARIQRLVVPGEPRRSPLLVNPLAEEAGGSHWHGGGKHWDSQDDPEWQMLSQWVSATTPVVDFDFYRARIEPILLNPRPGHARCIACHSRGGGNSFLEPLAPGSATYDEEQSRRNFDRIQRLIVAGEPLNSPLLVNPLAEEAGGSHWHGGGKHWDTRNDPEWQVLAAWVGGQPGR